MTYGAFGQQFGLPEFTLTWARRDFLDPAAHALRADRNIGLDLTFLLSHQETGYPSVIDGQPSNPPTSQQMARARSVADRKSVV